MINVGKGGFRVHVVVFPGDLRKYSMQDLVEGKRRAIHSWVDKHLKKEVQQNDRASFGKRNGLKREEEDDAGEKKMRSF